MSETLILVGPGIALEDIIALEEDVDEPLKIAEYVQMMVDADAPLTREVRAAQ